MKTLTEERQQAICDYALDHTLVEVRAWLDADGIKTSAAALSLFLGDRRLSNQLERNQMVSDRVIESLRKDGVLSTEDELARAGQVFFSALGIEQGDAKIWSAAQGVALKREEMAMARQRWEFDAAEECLAHLAELRTIAADAGMDQAGKLEAVRRRLFGVAATDAR